MSFLKKFIYSFSLFFSWILLVWMILSCFVFLLHEKQVSVYQVYFECFVFCSGVVFLQSFYFALMNISESVKGIKYLAGKYNVFSFLRRAFHSVSHR